MTNFTVQDLLGCSIATLLFPLVLVFPGYVFSYALNLFEFRKRLIFTQHIIAIVVSNAITPILLFLEYRTSSGKVVLASALILAILWVILFVKSLSAAQPVEAEVKRYQSIALILGGVWILAATFYLVDLQIGNRLYFTVASYDLTSRVSVVDAITRTGVPPVNPSYYPGHPVLLTLLYYFWYILGSVVEQAGGALVSPYQAMMASTIWSGISVAALTALYLRLRGGRGGCVAWRMSLLAAQIYTIGGLDFIPVMILMIETRILHGFTIFNGGVEGWNTPVMAWIHAVTWVPHHVASALACITAMLAFLYALNRGWKEQAAAAGLAALALASAFGLSVWVTVTFGVFFALWWIALLWKKESRRIAGWMVLSGITALLLAAPFIAGILQPGNTDSGGPPLELYIRPFSVVSEFLAKYPAWLQNLANLIFLPVNYLFELGFFALIALLWLQYKKSAIRTNTFYLAETILLSSVAIFLTFVRSTVIYVNDMGIRGWLLGQFVLVVWAADLLFDPEEKTVPRLFARIRAFAANHGMGNALTIIAVIGLLTSAMEITATRTWPMLIDAGIAGFPNNLSPDTQLGARTYAARQAYDFVRANLPLNIVMQNNPTEFLDRPSGLYGSRQTAIADRTAYGVPTDIFNNHTEQIGKIFQSRYANWTQIDQICHQFFIQVILVKDTDPLWQSLPVLEQQRQPLYKNPYVELFNCGK